MAWLRVFLWIGERTMRLGRRPLRPATLRGELGSAHRRTVGTVVVMCALAALACAPKQPTVVPQIARVLWVGPTGLRLAVEVDVHNPNSFSLMVNAVDGVL